MSLDKTNKSSGQLSLKLEAKRHIACTGPKAVDVKSGQHYLLSFDHNSKGRYGGYSATFNDEFESSLDERLEGTDGKWQKITTEIITPEDVSQLRLRAYAYPANLPATAGTANYDNFQLTAIPDVKDRFFVATDNLPTGEAPTATFASVNPTKTLVNIKNASKPFYISTKESYHNLWQLYLSTGQSGFEEILTQKIQVGEHLRLNNTMNGYYLDPETMCKNLPTGCIKNDDGSYNISLVMNFAPQKWFYVGCLISLVTGLFAIGFIVYDLKIRGRP
jgi:hypothetical protein